MRKMLVTGGMGFIGSNFILYMLNKYDDIHITNLDALTYAGNPDNLSDSTPSERYSFVKGNIMNHSLLDTLIGDQGIDTIVHFAAESHVDRSIEAPSLFAETNVMGTLCLLEAARKHGVQTFIQVSTDEVYGSLGPAGLFTEKSPLAPNSPYSSSKAGADLLARSYYVTFGLPVIITRCSNNYGPRQFPEKLIPLTIISALQDRPIPVYGDGMNVRDWLYVEDHCAAIDLVVHRGKAGEVYNIGGYNERSNLEIVRTILNHLGKPESLIEYVQDRPGHDRRYAIDSSRITKDLGWSPATSFVEGIQRTLAWYVTHERWWTNILNGEYYARKMRGGGSK